MMFCQGPEDSPSASAPLQVVPPATTQALETSRGASTGQVVFWGKNTWGGSVIHGKIMGKSMGK